ncbi:MAG: thioredoxin-dependent thiol peroxidase [Erysipelotrichaceae bacterium]|nr:thioredoxin-dependent thiol peroxidase [Erysipelotrichaceae bacterium]
MLKINEKAPSFCLPDQNGDIHTLEEYKGKKIILYFYPKDNTSGCTAQACNYRDEIKSFKGLNVEVIGVSKDSVKSHKKFERNYNLPFTLLSDTELKTINDYDVYKEKKLYGKPYMGVVRTTYLIDEKGTIIYASDKVKAKEDAINMLKLFE